jgi:copper(I)-binding protein
MTLINTGQETDRLLSASGDVANTIELHTHLLENNVMKMRKIDAIEVAPGEPTMLRPGGLHIMLIGLKKPLAAGQTFPLTLKFEKAGETSVQVTVRDKDAGAMPNSHQHQ